MMKRTLASWQYICPNLERILTKLILFVFHLAIFLMNLNRAGRFVILAVNTLLHLIWRGLMWCKSPISWIRCSVLSSCYEGWLGTILMTTEGIWVSCSRDNNLTHLDAKIICSFSALHGWFERVSRGASSILAETIQTLPFLIFA